VRIVVIPILIIAALLISTGCVVTFPAFRAWNYECGAGVLGKYEKPTKFHAGVGLYIRAIDADKAESDN